MFVTVKVANGLNFCCKGPSWAITRRRVWPRRFQRLRAPDPGAEGNPALRDTGGGSVLENEPPSYEKWAFYIALLEFALQLGIWLTS